MTTSTQQGQIVTFYSYKGGTGRSMALANTAWILASNGNRVLVVDWDLESPGLHQYLHPFLIDKALTSSRGTIDLIWDFASAAMSHDEVAVADAPDEDADWVANRARIERYAVSLDWEFPEGGTLDFVPTGRQDAAYSRRVSGIDWDRLYDRQGGGDFFARLRENMKENYDYVLVDSRTGFSDTGAICTVALPDVVVDCFTLSAQSIAGAYDAAASIRERSRSRHIRILPVPMRIEDAETNKLEAGRDDARRTFQPFLAHLDAGTRERYWGEVEIPYKPFYAYEEILATIGDRPRQENTLLAFYERLTSAITEGRVTELNPMDEADRRRWLAQFERTKRSVSADVFISHVEQDRMWADWIAHQLESVGYRVTLQGSALPPGGDLAVELQRTISAAACTLAVMSPDYLESQSAKHTWDAVSARTSSGEQNLLVPVLVSRFRPWGVFSSRVPVDIATLEADEAREELLAAVREPGLPPSGRSANLDDPMDEPRFPGDEPIVSNLPNRNPHFVGRDSMLLDLRQRLLSSTRTVVVPQALHGLGGVGKTQVVLEYAHRFGADYDLVWWLPAEQPVEARAQLAALAPLLNLGSLGEEPGDADRAVRAVVDALRRGDPYRRWLLIFDNADEPAELEALLPPGPGHVIVTSRNQGWAVDAETVEVDVFARDESIALLQRRGRDLSRYDSDRLAERLGDLPLALEQAAVWQSETGMSVEEYLQLFDERLELLLASGPPPQYPTSVAATWSIVFDRLRVQSPASVQMLELCAFFGPEPIPFRLLSLGRFAALPEPLAGTISDSILRRRAVREIGRYALAQVDPARDTLQVHRLVQAVLREGLTPQQRASYLANAHELMAAANPGAPDNRRTWTQHAELSPHLGPANLIDGSHDKIRKVVLDQVRYRYRRGDIPGSRDLAEQAYTRWGERPDMGPDDAQTLVASRFLADSLRWLGDSERARKLNEDAIVRLTRQFGADHEHTLATWNSVGADLRALGRFREARELDQDNLVRHRAVYGDDAPETLRCSHNLAVDLRLLGEFQEARDLDEDTLRRRRRVLEAEDSYILSSTANLARDQLNLGDFTGARAMLESVLADFRTLLPDDHVEILSAARAYSVALRMVGDYDAARRTMEENHALHLARFGPEHQLTLDTMISVGNNRRAAKDFSGARAISEDTLNRSRQVLGPEHPFTQAAAVNLGVVLRIVGDTGRARQLISDAYVVLESSLGPDHFFTVTCAANQATNLSVAGEFEAARALSEDVHERARRTRGDSHPDTLAYAINLALDRRSTGDSSGDQLQAEAVSAMRRVLGESHPVTLAAAAGKRGEFDIETPPT